ncbi:MAG: hypothetical protein H0U77_10800 [Nocardioidaceae bacterium]|nr:hypothetical protein [Nocardioidaceae bacterium]
MSSGSRGGRAALAAVAALLGAGVGVLATAVHRSATDAAGISWHWGIVLSVVASVAVSVGVATAGAGRAPVVAYGCGWSAAVLVLLGGRAEGDYLVAGDGLGWSFLVVSSLAVVAATLGGAAVAGHGPSRS